MTDVPVKFVLTVVRPDQRQYRQQEVELVCQQELEVLVPLTSDYIANSEEVIQAKLGSGNVLAANPRLTVAGLKYVIDQFDNVFLKETATTKDEDWGETDTNTEKKSETTVDDEDWEEAGGSDASKEENWNSDDEKWE